MLKPIEEGLYLAPKKFATDPVEDDSSPLLALYKERSLRATEQSLSCGALIFLDCYYIEAR